MKKKLLMILALAVLLVGCGNQQETNSPSTEQPSTPENTLTNEPTSTQTEPLHEHAYTETITTEATCIEAGEKTFTCDCGDTYTEPIEATGHNYEVVADSEAPATCTNDGKEADTKCSLCDDVISGTVIPATGHSYGEYVYNDNATSKKDGTESATCSICGDKTSRTKAGTKLPPWYEGYERYVWYDMGEYFFIIVDTQEEVVPITNTFPYYQTLRDRYPDRSVVQNGANILTDTYSVALFSALYMDPEKGFPIWSIEYPWANE